MKREQGFLPFCKTDLEIAFDRWMRTGQGKQVYEFVSQKALELRHRGFCHYSIDTIFSALRFNYDLKEGDDGSGYKLNNNHRAYLSSLIEEKNPQLSGFFEKRTRKKAIQA